MSIRKGILGTVTVAAQALGISFLVGLSGVACIAPFYIAARLLGMAP